MAIVGKWNLNGNGNDSSGNGYNLTVSNITYGDGILNQGGIFNGSTSSAISATGLNIPVTNFTLNAVINPTSIPSRSNFGEIFGILNSSAQYVIWLMLYQQKYYTLQGVGGGGGLVQPTTPIPVAGRRELLTVVGSATAITLYRNGIQIGTARGSFSATINQIKIGVGKYVGLIDEASLSNNNQSNSYIKNYNLLLNGYF